MNDDLSRSRKDFLAASLKAGVGLAMGAGVLEPAMRADAAGRRAKAATSALGAGRTAQPATAVPPRYAPIYQQISSALSTFEAEIDQLWNGQTTGTLFASESLYANSNNGPLLWDPHNYQECLTEITRQKTMGLGTAMMSVHFPYLYPDFYTTFPEASKYGSYQQYADFYTKIVSYARSLGMKIAIETQAIFPDPTLQTYYAGLSWDQYMQARNTTAQTLAQLLKPDFLALIEEPDTEEMITGQKNLLTVSGITQLIAPIAHDVKALNIPNLKLGAGSGTWYSLIIPLLPALLGIPEIDYYNLHCYPVSGLTPGSFLQNALHCVAVAHKYGKVTAIGECWTYKEDTLEYGSSVTPFDIFRRDPFSFWSPLDIQAIRCYMKLAYWSTMPFMSTYFTRYHFAYLDYNYSTYNLDYQAITALSTQVSETAMNALQFSTTGTTYSGYVTGTIPLK